MANKNNIRSIRFTDELYELIDRQTGDTFTQKLENLVTRCVWDLPQKERELEQIKQEIAHQRDRLSRIHKYANDLESTMNRMSGYLNNANYSIHASIKHLDEMIKEEA